MSDIAVLLPCYNEALTIEAVVKQFQAVLPEARVYVFDNNSKDDSVALAKAAGATVIRVPLQGKGNVVRRMFADIDADVYVMADADLTYDASRARELILPIISGEVDTVIGVREADRSAFPKGHVWGNKLFNLIVGRLFGHGMRDIFSGYRTFSYRFAKAFPAHSEGFEIETEMSIFILEQRIPYLEMGTKYGERPEGSVSKLKTYRDGMKIMLTILGLFKEARPLLFFSIIAAVLVVLSLCLGLPVIQEWRETGLVERLPTAVLAMGVGILAVLTWLGGLMLDSVARTTRETRHLRYLNVSKR